MSTSPAPRTPPLHTPDKEPQMPTAPRPTDRPSLLVPGDAVVVESPVFVSPETGDLVGSGVPAVGTVGVIDGFDSEGDAIVRHERRGVQYDAVSPIGLLRVDLLDAYVAERAPHIPPQSGPRPPASAAILDAAARIPRMEFSPGPLTVPASRVDEDRLRAAETASDLLGDNPTAADIATLAEYLCGGPVPLPR